MHIENRPTEKVGGKEAVMASKKRTPNLDGLSETFEVQVGGRKVTCAWIPQDYFECSPSNQEVIEEIARRHLRCPNRNIAAAAFDLKKEELAANPSSAVDGVVRTGTFGGRFVGCMLEDGDGRYLYLDFLHGRWHRHFRFLMVVSE